MLVAISEGSDDDPVPAHKQPWPVHFDTKADRPCYHLYDPETGEVMETRPMPTNATEAMELYPNPSRSPLGEREMLERHYGIKPGA